MLRPTDYRGVYAIIPTPAREGSDRLDAINTVDLAETSRLVEALIEAGCTGIIALGTTGECATLLNDDYDKVVRCILETARGRVKTVIGTSALGGQEAVRRSRLAQDGGADAILLGLPQWQVCTDEMAIKFYAGVAEIFPDLAIMVYANTRAFRFPFGDEFWAECARSIPSITAAKLASPKRLAGVLKVAGDRIHFMPNEITLAEFVEIAPQTTTSCWATAASMGPEPVLAMMNAVLAGDVGRMAAVNADLAWANEPVAPLVDDPDAFASFNIQMEKIRFNAAGYCNAGPIRPPYDVMPDRWAAASRECGTRWAEMRKNYVR